ncbi:unnamed protein product [Brugia pahangi]|uniref:PH domain-containing protein n=1 Tax=Brugia pahangi TaxID=6280 RepID=A0A0N4TT09_BRUPA|nr:unnamed protein product [Brugia pahangi]
MPIGTSRSSDLSLELGEKCGWLLKWTNYIKGYRQRWFVLDSCANLKQNKYFGTLFPEHNVQIAYI